MAVLGPFLHHHPSAFGAHTEGRTGGILSASTENDATRLRIAILFRKRFFGAWDEVFENGFGTPERDVTFPESASFVLTRMPASLL